jgi:hypothetical protein
MDSRRETAAEIARPQNRLAFQRANLDQPVKILLNRVCESLFADVVDEQNFRPLSVNQKRASSPL